MSSTGTQPEHEPSIASTLGVSGLGGTSPPTQGGPLAKLGGTKGKLAGLGQGLAPEIRITADHRACADFFAVYVYNIYRRREMAKMWRSLSWAYEHVMENFASLLDRNASLKPMVESVSAQLKRGAMVGFDKAFVSKPSAKKDDTGAGNAAATGKLRPG